MEKILVLTKDGSLLQEVSAVIPKGYKVISEPPPDAGEQRGAYFVLVDIDTCPIYHVEGYSEKTFVIAVTQQERTGPVMEAAMFGAYEIVRRPLKKERIARILDELHDLGKELSQVISITKDTLAPAATCAIVGRSAIIMGLCEKVARIAQVEVPVLITGETGTGKELVAEAIAQLSSRFGRPFVVINSAAVPDTLLESELFGYEKGAFTGAVAPKEGMLKTADDGCVFFDEVGELPLALQGKLLRFIQTQTFYPVGSTKEVQVNVRVVSATNRDLAAMVREGKFREDLYHRLRVATIHVPPLRDRKKDIPPLVQCLFYRHAHTAQKSLKGVTQAFMDKLLAYDWPGNIRELENTLRSAIALCKTAFLTTHELKELGSHSLAKGEKGFSENLAAILAPYVKEKLEQRKKNIYGEIHEEIDRHVLNYVLSSVKENQSEAARLLGISRLTLRKKLGMS
jgi:DNA-binding NtrC family response regulator